MANELANFRLTPPSATADIEHDEGPALSLPASTRGPRTVPLTGRSPPGVTGPDADQRQRGADHPAEGPSARGGEPGTENFGTDLNRFP
jgi:hypothetical protein